MLYLLQARTHKTEKSTLGNLITKKKKKTQPNQFKFSGFSRVVL